MIERKIIEDLVSLMVEHDLIELDVVDGEQSITLRRGGDASGMAFMPQMQGMMPMGQAPPAQAGAAPAAGAASADSGAAAPEDGGPTIDSPMVGTYYSKPNPDADSFIGVGDKVSDSSVVCLIEAMKVFNEVKASCRGTITEVLVNDGDPVEYGQPLFRYTPA